VNINCINIALANMTLFKAEVPVDLLIKMIDEVEKIEQDVASAEETTSGLTSKGVPKHYRFTKDTEDLLKQYILECTMLYRDSCHYLRTFDSPKITPEYYCERPWINFQKSGEFIPNHMHGGVLSYAIWLRIPEVIDEHQDKFSGQLEFTYTDILGRTQGSTMGVNKYSVGTTLLFPSLLRHCVYPFSDSTETRISVSGNVFLGKEP
jgi:hypothetical protein